MDTAAAKYQFQICQRVLQRNLDGVDDDAGLRSPASGANSLNWVIGHLAQARASTVQLLGGAPVPGAEALDSYQAQNSGEFTAEKALPLSRLKELLEELHQALMKSFDDASPDVLAAAAPFSPVGNPQETISSLVASLAFHEAYHCGQTGVLRRELGLDGAIRGPGQPSD